MLLQEKNQLVEGVVEKLTPVVGVKVHKVLLHEAKAVLQEVSDVVPVKDNKFC